MDETDRTEREYRHVFNEVVRLMFEHDPIEINFDDTAGPRENYDDLARDTWLLWTKSDTR